MRSRLGSFATMNEFGKCSASCVVFPPGLDAMSSIRSGSSWICPSASM